ncbi:hypothetical protein F511_32499 [Dorcoceras hygrometricum]|uniref:Uncharacterized protein n=1 Tax=Dorcoceras hygrometricum TaxID=472368 RepID=A0A2Z7D831_9LAMI|nr:hypothetical protein F511_32499 [Dorcoceras hygrometricum]
MAECWSSKGIYILVAPQLSPIVKSSTASASSLLNNSAQAIQDSSNTHLRPHTFVQFVLPEMLPHSRGRGRAVRQVVDEPRVSVNAEDVSWSRVLLRHRVRRSEKTLLCLPFFRNGNDQLEDFDYNDPRCNPLLRPATARTPSIYHRTLSLVRSLSNIKSHTLGSSPSLSWFHQCLPRTCVVRSAVLHFAYVQTFPVGHIFPAVDNSSEKVLAWLYFVSFAFNASAGYLDFSTRLLLCWLSRFDLNQLGSPSREFDGIRYCAIRAGFLPRWLLLIGVFLHVSAFTSLPASTLFVLANSFIIIFPISFQLLGSLISSKPMNKLGVPCTSGSKLLYQLGRPLTVTARYLRPVQLRRPLTVLILISSRLLQSKQAAHVKILLVMLRHIFIFLLNLSTRGPQRAQLRAIIGEHADDLSEE